MKHTASTSWLSVLVLLCGCDGGKEMQDSPPRNSRVDMRRVIKSALFCLAVSPIIVTSLISLISLSGCGGNSQTSSLPQSPTPPANNPVPVVSSLSVTSAPAGWPGVPLLITGSGFVAGTTMRWNGSDRPSTSLGSSALRTAIPIGDLAQSGNAEVSVFSPGPGGGVSNTTTFNIEAVAVDAFGVVERSSVSTNLTEADSDSSNASISADGRYVAFDSMARNLAGGGGNFADVFLRDTCVGAPAGCTPSVTLISLSSQGQSGNDGSFDPSISATGRFVAFSSAATNLVSSDTNGFSDVFVSDTCIGASTSCAPSTMMASLDGAGNQIPLHSGFPHISGNGRFVAFASFTIGTIAGEEAFLSSIINVRDTCMGAPAGCSPTTSQTDVGPGGVSANANSFSPIISSSGRYVAFQSMATNLVTPNLNSGVDQVFLADTCIGTSGCTPSMTLVSVDQAGSEISQSGSLNAMSSDGRFVVFSSPDNNIVAGDSNGFDDVFVRDTCNGAPAGCVRATTRVSLANDGNQGNGHSFAAAVGASARFIAFSSEAANLVTGDSNNTLDVFLRDTCIGTAGVCVPSTVRLSVALDGTQSDDLSFVGGITANGRHAVLISQASSVAPGDINSAQDIFLARTNVP